MKKTVTIMIITFFLLTILMTGISVSSTKKPYTGWWTPTVTTKKISTKIEKIEESISRRQSSINSYKKIIAEENQETKTKKLYPQKMKFASGSLTLDDFSGPIVGMLDNKKFQDARVDSILEKTQGKIPPDKKLFSSFENVEIGAATEIYLSTFLTDKKGKEQEYGEFRFLPKINWDIGNFFFNIKGDFRFDTENYAHGAIDDGFTESHEPYMINLRECYVGYQQNIFQIIIGKKIIDWSRVETVSASDFSPRDYTDPSRWERVGQTGINIKAELENSSLDIFYTPKSTSAKMPQKESRISQDPPNGLTIDADKIDKNHDQFAACAGFFIVDWSIFIHYIDGYNPNPYYEMRIKDNLPVLSPRYVDRKIYSMAVEKEFFNGLIGKTEIGYFDQEGAEDYTQFTFSVEKRIHGIFNEMDNLFFLFQYTKANKAMEDYNICRVFDETAISRIEYKKNEKIKLGVDSIHNFGDGSYHNPYIKIELPKITLFLNMKGGTNLEIGADFINGSKKFVARHDEKRIYTNLTINF